MSSPRSRRTFVRPSLTDLGGLVLAADAHPATPASPTRPLNIVCVGAHPDDPEDRVRWDAGRVRRAAAEGFSALTHRLLPPAEQLRRDGLPR